MPGAAAGATVYLALEPAGAFLGYAKAGSGGGPHAAADAMLPAFSRHGTPDRHPAAVPDGRPAPDALSGSRTPRPWWEH